MRTSRPVFLARILEAVPGLELGAGDPGVEVTGLGDDSRKIEPGDLFVSLPGARHDGIRFLPDALAGGAAAILVPEGFRGSSPVPVLVARGDLRETLSRLAGALFADVLEGLVFHGVTGTNGKTTTTHLMAAVLNAAGTPAAVIGTLGSISARGERVPSPNTTPGPIDLLETLASLKRQGHQAIVMEVSSQALAQHRTDFLPFRTAAWTNLSPEHMELHNDYETYRRVKVSFFERCGRRAGEAGARGFASILNLDDPEFPAFYAPCPERVVGYRLTGGGAPPTPPGVDLIEGVEIASGLDGGVMDVRAGGRSCRVEVRLGGRFNLYNALVAMAMAEHLGIDPETARDGIGGVARVAGRFQRVPGEKRRVIVDYAHTSEGLDLLLQSCRAMIGPGGKLVVVFGCGGDRDPSKRPRMGRSAARFADIGVITDDNPRHEAPERITSMILEGIAPADRARFPVEHDRRAAIRRALELSGPEDLIVVAGKGHEDYQIVGTAVRSFDDVEVVKEILEGL